MRGGEFLLQARRLCLDQEDLDGTSGAVGPFDDPQLVLIGDQCRVGLVTTSDPGIRIACPVLDPGGEISRTDESAPICVIESLASLVVVHFRRPPPISKDVGV